MILALQERLYVSWAHDGKRLDVFVSELMPNLSRSRIKELARDGKVCVNGVVRKPSYVVHEGDVIQLDVPDEVGISASALVEQAHTITFDILYEDEHVLIINKPRGVVVHPNDTVAEPTIMHALVARGYQLSSAAGPMRRGIVHRLDKNTSGCLVIAKTDEAHLSLQRQFANRCVEKLYFAIVVGNPTWDEQLVTASIGRHPTQRQRMTVLKSGGKVAETYFWVRERYQFYALLEARLFTGRTHQVRVHAAYLQHPVVGDTRYNGRKRALAVASELGDETLAELISKLLGQALHAHTIGLHHPVHDERIAVSAPLPDDMRELIRHLRRYAD